MEFGILPDLESTKFTPYTGPKPTIVETPLEDSNIRLLIACVRAGDLKPSVNSVNKVIGIQLQEIPIPKSTLTPSGKSALAFSQTKSLTAATIFQH